MPLTPLSPSTARLFFFFFNDTATTEIYTLSLHDALPIYPSPARQVLGLSSRPAQIAAWNKSNGYDDPVIVQYLRYLNNLVHGNLGYSYTNNQSVYALFSERVARSAYLSGISLLIAVIIA